MLGKFLKSRNRFLKSRNRFLKRNRFINFIKIPKLKELTQHYSLALSYAAWFPHSTWVTLISHCLPVVVSVPRKLKFIVAESDAVAPRST